MTARTSLTPADTADSWAKCRPVEPATRVASVVLPVPGGPYSSIEDGDPPCTSRRSGAPGPEQMRLPDHLVQVPRPHPGGQRVRAGPPADPGDQAAHPVAARRRGLTAARARFPRRTDPAHSDSPGRRYRAGSIRQTSAPASSARVMLLGSPPTWTERPLSPSGTWPSAIGLTPLEILRYAAFTTTPTGGNPAGIVLDAGGLDAAEMQRIAAEVGFSETAFLVPTGPQRRGYATSRPLPRWRSAATPPSHPR